MTGTLAPGRAGLLRVLKDLGRSNARFEASVVTTYAFNGIFYEDVLLRSFERAGSRLNIVLADAGQLASAMEDPARRPVRAGRDYILCPVVHTRAFHPKILMLLSEKESLLAIGSHNLTDAGFGHNEEVTTLWHRPAPPPSSLLQGTWDYVIMVWLSRADGLPATQDEFSARLYSLADTAPNVEKGEARLAVDGNRSLLATLATAVTEPVKRVVVVGPYFDSDFAFLHRLDATFSPDEIIVALDPTSALVASPALAPANARFYDIVTVTTGLPRRGDPGFQHAKIIALETRGGPVVSVGSANPTLAAWTHTQGGNAEANVILTGAAARQAWEQLGLGLLGNASALEAIVLEQAAERSAAQRQLDAEASSQATAIPVLASALEPDGMLLTGLPPGISAAGITLRLFNGLELQAADPPASADGLWIPNDGLSAGVHSLYRGGELIAYVILHDPARVKAGLMSQGGAQLLASLGRIDQYEGFDEVFELIMRHVLPEAPASMQGPSRPGTGAGGENLDVDRENGSPTGDRRARFEDDPNHGKVDLQKGGLIEELITALLGSLYTQPQTAKDGDAPDKDSEDIDDGEPDPEDFAAGEVDGNDGSDADWSALVRACRQKVTTLTKRLRSQVKAIEGETTLQTGQVIAVLCLVQKLRMLPAPPEADERSAKDSLIEVGQLGALRDITLNWADKPGLLSDLPPAELNLLVSLLAWYLRETGGDFSAAAPFGEDETKRQERLQAHANLVAISWLLAAEESSPFWLSGRDDQLARWADSKPCSSTWLERHLGFGRALRKAASGNLLRGPTLKAGDIVLQGNPPGRTWPRIVQRAAPAKAWLWVPGGGKIKPILTSVLYQVSLISPSP